MQPNSTAAAPFLRGVAYSLLRSPAVHLETRDVRILLLLAALLAMTGPAQATSCKKNAKPCGQTCISPSQACLLREKLPAPTGSTGPAMPGKAGPDAGPATPVLSRPRQEGPADARSRTGLPSP